MVVLFQVLYTKISESFATHVLKKVFYFEKGLDHKRKR